MLVNQIHQWSSSKIVYHSSWHLSLLLSDTKDCSFDEEGKDASLFYGLPNWAIASRRDNYSA